MQTFLIVSSDHVFIEKEIDKKKNALSVSAWNYHEIMPTPSIGIDAVRGLQHLLAQKPYDGGNRLVVIRGIHQATVEAQNSLLKLLEEPPKDTAIILTSPEKESLLQTVTSRSSVIIQSMKDNTIQIDLSKTRISIIDLCKASPGQRVVLTQSLFSSKEDALTLLHSIIYALEENLHQKTIPELSLKDTAQMLKKIETARSYIERNINYKATLDILFLGFPKIP